MCGARDEYGIVSMRGMTCGYEWPHIKYFGILLNLLQLNDFSLLILTLNDA